jgi:Na+-driven multidrug efflux pump
LPGRVRAALRDALWFVLLAVIGAWAILAAAQDYVVLAFSLHGGAEAMVRLFCSSLAGSFLFTGALYVANALFNNLGFPYLSTLFNWGRATLGTIPFVAWGSAYGPRGVLIGQAAGSVIFGTLAAVCAFRLVDRLAGHDPVWRHLHVPVPSASTGGAALAAYAARPRHRPRS